MDGDGRWTTVLGETGNDLQFDGKREGKEEVRCADINQAQKLLKMDFVGCIGLSRRQWDRSKDEKSFGDWIDESSGSGKLLDYTINFDYNQRLKML